MKLLLIGLPKVGKSSAGKEAARLLGVPFIDLDQEIEKASGYSSRELVRREGIDSFRLQEQQQLFNLKGGDAAIVALGGGIVELPENRDFLQMCGTVVYLENDPEELWNRMDGLAGYLDPADPKGSFFKLAARREPLYEAIAHHKLAVQGLSVAEIAQAIAKMIRKVK